MKEIHEISFNIIVKANLSYFRRYRNRGQNLAITEI